MEKLIAFQTVDSENDIWCNTALLFKTEKKAIEFFNNPKLVLETLEIELNDEEIEEGIELEKIYTGDGKNGMPYQITFNCEYAGDVRISNMSKGFVFE